jgi:hypothetical protein
MAHIILHPDNHRHDGMKVVFQNLLGAASRNEIVLLCESNLYDNSSTEITVNCHGLTGTGHKSRLNGIESAIDTLSMCWAMASQLAIRSGRGRNTVIKSTHAEGALLMREFCVMWALLDPSHDSLLCDEGMMNFIRSLRVTIAAEINATCFWSGCLQMCAHKVMRGNKSKWPGADRTFGELASLCEVVMPAIGTWMQGSMEQRIDEILVTNREKNMAANIAKCAALTKLPVHVIIGASHCVPLISSDSVTALCLDENSFREQERKIEGPRLTDLIDCTVVSDVFQML